MKKASKYHQLAEELLQRIAAGEFPENKLPSMQKLATEYSVNLLTISRAVKSLEKGGAVSCHNGNVGTRIDRGRAKMLVHSIGQLNRDTGLHLIERVMIRFLFSNGRELPIFQEAARRFTERYPWAEVELIQCANASQSILNDELFDCAIISQRDVASFYAAGRLRSVPLSAEHRDEDFMANLYRHVACLPFLWEVPALAVRDGVPATDTWTEFIRAMAAPADGCTTQVRMGLYSLMIGTLDHFSGRLTNDGDDERILELLKALHAVCDQNCDGTYLWNNQQSLTPEVVKNLKMIGSHHLTGQLDLAQWHFRSVPGGGSQTAANVVLVISSTTAAPVESLLWSNFLLRDDIQQLFKPCFSMLPVKRRVFESLALPKNWKEFLENALENAVYPPLSGRTLFMFYSSVFPLLERCFAGELTYSFVAVELSRRFREITSITQEV